MFEVGQKVSIPEGYSRYHVTIARKGSVAVIEGFTSQTIYNGGIPDLNHPHVKLKLNNGSVIEIPQNRIVPYAKKEVEVIEKLSNEDLVERLETLSAHEVQMRSGTKANKKVLNDITRCKDELLKRLGGRN